MPLTKEMRFFKLGHEYGGMLYEISVQGSGSRLSGPHYKEVGFSTHCPLPTFGPLLPYGHYYPVSAPLPPFLQILKTSAASRPRAGLHDPLITALTTSLQG